MDSYKLIQLAAEACDDKKGINIKFDLVPDANHFFSNSEENLKKYLNKYISKESALF